MSTTNVFDSVHREEIRARAAEEAIEAADRQRAAEEARRRARDERRDCARALARAEEIAAEAARFAAQFGSEPADELAFIFEKYATWEGEAYEKSMVAHDEAIDACARAEDEKQEWIRVVEALGGFSPTEREKMKIPHDPDGL